MGGPRFEEQAALAAVRARLVGASIPPTLKLSRYEVLRRIGQGEFGTVYVAHDPELDRNVAVKLVRARHKGSANEARFLREAQALASLRHENVVQVYDVGAADVGGVYIVMELLRGQTLRAWLTKNAPPREAVVDAFRKVGLGLAAAHEADIVHRDVKAHNVIITDGGEVKVVDFGLATISAAVEPSSSSGGHPSQSGRDLTRSGDVMGTPLYMAPEQHEGRAASPASDQYAFCMALYEALHREFRLRDAPYEELRAIKQRGSWPRHGIPRRLHRALMRGLHPDPARRFHTMRELVAALRPRTTRPAIAATTLGAVLVSAVALAAAREEPTDTIASASGRLPGPASGALLAVAHYHHGLALLTAGDQRAALDAFDQALWIAQLHGAPVLAAKAVPRALALRMDLGTFDAGQLSALQEVVDRAADPLSAAETRALLANERISVGDPAVVVAEIRGALAELEAAGLEDAVAYGQIHLYLGSALVRQKRFEDAQSAIDRGIAQLEAVGADDAVVASGYERRGYIYRHRGQLEAAKAAYRVALAKFEGDRPHPRTLRPLMGLANVAIREERFDAAATLLRRAIDALGVDPPPTEELGTALANLSVTEFHSGDLEASVRHAQRARQVLAEIAVPDPMDVADADLKIGILSRTLGRYDQASAALVRALETYIKLRVPERAAPAHFHLGTTFLAQERFAEAEVHLRAAAAVMVDKPELATQLATTRRNLAQALAGRDGQPPQPNPASESSPPSPTGSDRVR